MKLALVFDAPRTTGVHIGMTGTYLDMVVSTCQRAVNESQLDIKDFFAVSEVQPGGKTPPIADIRAERDRLLDELEEWGPDMILSLGAGALNAVGDSQRVLSISKERGRMRLVGEVPWLPTLSPYSVMRAPDLHRDFANDVFKALSQRNPMPSMTFSTLVPDSLELLSEYLGVLEDASVVGVDVETTGLRPHSDELMAVGFGVVTTNGDGIAVIVPPSLLLQDGVRDILWDAIWRVSRRSVGHNFKFDMQFLAPLVGWAPDDAQIGDTLLMAHLLDERPNRPDSRVRGIGLKDMVATRYDVDYGFDFTTFYENPDWDALYKYLSMDVCYTARLWHDLKAEADRESPRLLRTHDELLIPVSKAIARCEWGGAPIDVSWVRETVDAFDRRIARRQGAVEHAIRSLAPTMVIDNVLSPQQVADVMYDEWGMTPDVRRHGVLVVDDRSTDKDHVKSAVSKYLGTSLDRQAKWLRSLERLRRDVKTRTTYQKSLLDRADEDGRIRASFLIHGTSTGRLSSQGPNLQNVPAIDREDSSHWRPMRQAFRPINGRVWVEVDYSQLELRVAAALSGDTALIEVFKSGRDVHMEVATAIFSRPAEQISKSERFLAKAVGFGIIYGRGARALSSGAEMRYVEQKLGGKAWTEAQADAFIRKFLKSYPDLARWMDRLQEESLIAGYVETPFGRRRRFPLTPRSRGELGAIRRQAVNTPVQSAASDICLTAMVHIQPLLEDIGAQVLFPVHDSICIECAEDQIDTVEKICRQAMERDFMGVPLTVDFEYGPTWAEIKRVEPRFDPSLGNHTSKGRSRATEDDHQDVHPAS